MPLQELFDWQEHLSDHSSVLYPVKGRGQRAVEAIFFGLNQLQQPVAHDSSASLRASLAEYVPEHWEDLSQLHGPVQQQAVLDAVDTGNWDQTSCSLLLAAAAQMCAVHIKLHPVGCACSSPPESNTTAQGRSAQPVLHLACCSSQYLAASPLSADQNNLYQPLFQCSLEHSACTRCLHRCQMCRSVLSSDDRRHLRHFVPASCIRLDRLGGVIYHAQLGQQLGSGQMGFYAYCIACDHMFSTMGEGAFGPWFGECLDHFNSSHSCQGSRAEQVRHGFMSILTRTCMLSQTAAENRLFLPTLDQLRRYVRFSSFVQINNIPVAAMVHMASQRSVNDSRFPDSLVTTVYNPMPSCSDGTFAVVLHLGPFILLGGTKTTCELPEAAGSLITATGSLAVPEIARRVALPDLYAQLQEELPRLYVQMARAVQRQPPQHRNPPAGQPAINAGQLTIHEHHPPLLPKGISEARARVIAGQLENQQLAEFTIVRSWKEHTWLLSLAKPSSRPTFNQQDFRLLAIRSQTAATREVLMWLHGSLHANDGVQLRWGDQHVQNMVQVTDPLPALHEELSAIVQQKLKGKRGTCSFKMCLLSASLQKGSVIPSPKLPTVFAIEQ